MTSHVRPALVGLETADLGRASVDLALSNEVSARPRGGPEHNCGPVHVPSPFCNRHIFDDGTKGGR
jgi:hypothetical protein